MKRKTRKPIQKRDLEKYNRIIDASFKLFNEKGYFNTTTADIAIEANVATGSVYSYFEDKKDIYLQVLKKINDKFEYPTKTFWIENNDKDLKDPQVWKFLFQNFFDIMIQYHNFSKQFNDDQCALILLDKDIHNWVKNEDEIRMAKIKEAIREFNIPFKSKNHLNTFINLSYMLIDNICHKVLYNTDTNKNKDLYVNSSVNMLYSLFMDCTNYN
ncbi:MAG: TetR/AcrR family transcriptional regulator [Clostridium sp.]|nr:TetR/AcrR family transcriptional regulator [Clostridium sp.]